MSHELSMQEQLEAVMDGFQSLDIDGTSATNLFVANLPDNANDDSLKNMFSTFGNIISCKVMIDFNSGKSRGFGFVKFETPAQGISLSGVLYSLYFNPALSPTSNSSNEWRVIRRQDTHC